MKSARHRLILLTRLSHRSTYLVTHTRGPCPSPRPFSGSGNGTPGTNLQALVHDILPPRTEEGASKLGLECVLGLDLRKEGGTGREGGRVGGGRDNDDDDVTVYIYITQE